MGLLFEVVLCPSVEWRVTGDAKAFDAFGETELVVFIETFTLF
jgi:hypothetical protein